MGINEDIELICHREMNKLPFPVKCRITKVYDDNKHTDISTDIGSITYAETIGNNIEIGNVGVLMFLNGNNTEYIVITK